MVPPPAQTDPTRSELTAVAALFVVLTGVVMAPLLGGLTTLVAGGTADPRLNSWVLGWGAQRLPFGLQGFWSPPAFYPYQNALAYSENLLGVTALVAPVYWLSRNITLTYNVAFLLSYVVAGTGAYLLARELTGRRDAAIIAGCAFAFAPYRWAQLPHLQVLSTGWLPLILWALHRVTRAPSWPMVAALVAAVLLQTFSNGYAAFQVALAAPLVAGWAIARHGLSRALLLRATAAAAVGGVLLAPAVVAYVRVWASRTPLPGDLARYAADLGTYVSVAPGLPLSAWLPGVTQAEGNLFPGVVVVLLAAVAFVPIRRTTQVARWRWLYLTLAVVALVVSLGPAPQAWGRPVTVPRVYDWLLNVVPLFNALRVPARFGLLTVLSASLLAAMGAARLFSLTGRRTAVAVATLLCAVVVWEGWGHPLELSAGRVWSARGDQAAYAWLARQPRGVVLDLPISTLGQRNFALEHQIAALEHGHLIVGGASRIQTPLQDFLGGSASPLGHPSLLEQAVPFLRGVGVRYVLLRPEQFRDPAVAARLIDTLGFGTGSQHAMTFGDVVAFVIDPGVAAAPPAGLVRVPTETIRASASHEPDRVSFALDGDVNSRWLSARPQDGTEVVTLDFDEPRRTARLEFLVHPRSVRDYPRRLQVSAVNPAGAERVVFDGPILGSLGQGWARSPEQPIIAIDLPTEPTARLVLRQTGSAQPWYWSIDELIVWARP